MRVHYMTYRIIALLVLLFGVCAGGILYKYKNSLSKYLTHHNINLIHAQHHSSNVFKASVLKSHNSPNSSVLITRSDVGNVYTVYFSNEIKGPLAYTDLLTLLPTLTKEDTVVLHLSGYGGDVAGTMPMMNALKASKAKIVADVVGNIYSAHAYLTCPADEIIMRDETMMMFHMSSIVRDPSVDDHTRMVHKESGEIFIKKHCSHLVSEIDIIRMGEGMDLYYTPKDIKRFLKGDSNHKLIMVD